jgi:hypothetical protein
MICALYAIAAAIASPLLLLAGAGWWVSRDPDAEQNWQEIIG